MKKLLLASTALLLTAAPFAARANIASYDTKEQESIEEGLKSGDLTTKEAGKLEENQKHIDAEEAKYEKDGKMTKAETQHIRNLQIQQNKDIEKQKNDSQKGNPHSVSNERMQKDVGRDAAVEAKVSREEKNGTMTTEEASKIQAEQAHAEKVEGHDASNNGLSKGDQEHINRIQDHTDR